MGCRRTRDQRTWLQTWLPLIERQPWYACRKNSTAAVVRDLALHMNWRTRLSRPGHERIAAATPGRLADGSASTETVRRVIRWLEDVGALGVVSGGTCAEVRAGVLYSGSPSLAAVYVLTEPRKRTPLPRPSASGSESVDLTTSRREVVRRPRTREARAGRVKTREARAARGQPHVPLVAEAWPKWENPQNRSEGLAAGAVISQHDRLLGQLSPQHWRHLAGRFTDHGYCPGDVLYALGHEPGGREHRFTAPIRNVAGWARKRLDLWLDSDGVPLPPVSQRRAAERERTRARQAAMREAGILARTTAAAAEDPGPAGSFAEALAAARVVAERSQVAAGRGDDVLGARFAAYRAQLAGVP